MKGMEYSERGNAGGRKGKGGHAEEGGAIVAEEGLGGGEGGAGWNHLGCSLVIPGSVWVVMKCSWCVTPWFAFF